MNQSKQECQQLNNWFAKFSYQYEIPYCLTAQYIDDIVFCHTLSNHIMILTSRPLKHMPQPIQVNYFSNAILQKKSIRFIQINHRITFTQPQLEAIYKFNVQFHAQWYRIAPKNLDNHTISIQEFKQGGYRNYLFAPSENTLEDVDMFNSQYNACVTPLTKLDYASKERTEELYFQPKNQILYCLYKVITNVWETTIQELFQFYLDHQEPGSTMDQIKLYYEISDCSRSVGYLFYEHQFNNMRTNITAITEFRQIHQKQLEFGIDQRKSPIAIVKYATGIQSMQFFSDDQVDSLQQDIQAKSTYSIKPKLILQKPIMNIIPIDGLCRYHYSVEQYDNYLQMPFIMLELEQQLIIQEISQMVNIPNTSDLRKAVTRPSHSCNNNYELLETLGDSILKYIATIHVVGDNQNTNENELSRLRSAIVNNNYLGCYFFKECHIGLNFYTRALAHQTKWFSPVLNSISLNYPSSEAIKPSKAKMLTNFVADIFESLIAAAFQNKYSLQDAYNFMQLAQHPAAIHPIRGNFYPSRSIVIDSLKCKYHVDMSFMDLLADAPQLPTKLIKQLEDNNIDDSLEFLQINILRYTFKNKYILMEAFNCTGKPMNLDISLFLYYRYLQETKTPSPRGHSILELLGDAVLECFIVSNLFNKIQSAFTPNNLYKIKMLLLSNSFMAKVALAYGIHNFIRDDDECSIANFVKDVDLNQPFRGYNGNFVRVPKVLSDVFEAICGAVLLDGGWDAIIGVYGRIYGQFIDFVAEYLNQMDDHVIDRIHIYSAQQQGHMDMNITRDKAGIATCQIRINGKVVGSASHQFERVAKEKAAQQACNRFQI